MDKMKKNKFDARFLNKIVTIFSIIFIVILVMASKFKECIYGKGICYVRAKKFWKILFY